MLTGFEIENWGARYAVILLKPPWRPVSSTLLGRGPCPCYFRCPQERRRVYLDSILGKNWASPSLSDQSLYTTDPSYRWPLQLTCYQRSPLSGSLRLMLLRSRLICHACFFMFSCALGYKVFYNLYSHYPTNPRGKTLIKKNKYQLEIMQNKVQTSIKLANFVQSCETF